MPLHPITNNNNNRPNRLSDTQQKHQRTTVGDDGTENMSTNVSVNTLAGFLIDSNADVLSHSIGGASPRTELQPRQHAHASESPSKPPLPAAMNENGAAVIEALNQFIYQAGSIYHRGKRLSAREEHDLRESAKGFGLSMALIDALIDQTGDANSIVRYCMSSNDSFAKKIKKDGNLARLIEEGKERGESNFDLAGSIWRIFMLKIVQQFLKDHGMDLRHVMEHSSLTARLYEQAVRARKPESHHHNNNNRESRPKNQLDVQADAMRIRDFTQERKKVFIPPSEAREARKAADALMKFSPKPMFHDIMSDANDNPLFMVPASRKERDSSPLRNSRRQTMESNISGLDSRDDDLSTRAPIHQTGYTAQSEKRTPSLPPKSSASASNVSTREGPPLAITKTPTTPQMRDINTTIETKQRSNIPQRQAPSEDPDPPNPRNKLEIEKDADEPKSAVKRALAIFEKDKVKGVDEGPSNRSDTATRNSTPIRNLAPKPPAGRHSIGPSPRQANISAAKNHDTQNSRRNSSPIPTRHSSPSTPKGPWTPNRHYNNMASNKQDNSWVQKQAQTSPGRQGNVSAPPNRRWENSKPQIAQSSPTRPGTVSAPPSRSGSKFAPNSVQMWPPRQGSISAPPSRPGEDPSSRFVQEKPDRPEPRDLFPVSKTIPVEPKSVVVGRQRSASNQPTKLLGTFDKSDPVAETSSMTCDPSQPTSVVSSTQQLESAERKSSTPEGLAETGAPEQTPSTRPTVSNPQGFVSKDLKAASGRSNGFSQLKPVQSSFNQPIQFAQPRGADAAKAHINKPGVGHTGDVSSKRMEALAKFEKGIGSSRTAPVIQPTQDKPEGPNWKHKAQTWSEKREKIQSGLEPQRSKPGDERTEPQTKINSGRRIGFHSLVGEPIVTMDSKTSSIREDAENSTPRKISKFGGNVMSAVKMFEKPTEVAGSEHKGVRDTKEEEGAASAIQNQYHKSVPSTPSTPRFIVAQEPTIGGQDPKQSTTRISAGREFVKQNQTLLPQEDKGSERSSSPQNKEMRALHRIPDVVTMDPYEDGLDAIFSSLTQSSASEEDMDANHEHVTTSNGRGRYKGTPINRRMRKVPRSGERKQPSATEVKDTGDEPSRGDEDALWEGNGRKGPPAYGKDPRSVHLQSGHIVEHGDPSRDPRRNAQQYQPQGKLPVPPVQDKSKNIVFAQGVRTALPEEPGYIQPRGKVSTPYRTHHTSNAEHSTKGKKKPSQEEEDDNFFEAFFAPPKDMPDKSVQDTNKIFPTKKIVGTESSNEGWVAFKSDQRAAHISDTHRNNFTTQRNRHTGEPGLSSDRGEDESWFPSDEGASETSGRAKKHSTNTISQESRADPTEGWATFGEEPMNDISILNERSASVSKISGNSSWVAFETETQGGLEGWESQPSNPREKTFDNPMDPGKHESQPSTPHTRTRDSKANAVKVGSKVPPKFEVKDESRAHTTGSGIRTAPVRHDDAHAAPSGASKQGPNFVVKSKLDSSENPKRPSQTRESKHTPGVKNMGEWNKRSTESKQGSIKSPHHHKVSSQAHENIPIPNIKKGGEWNKPSTVSRPDKAAETPLSTVQSARAQFEGRIGVNRGAGTVPADSGVKREGRLNNSGGEKKKSMKKIEREGRSNESGMYTSHATRYQRGGAALSDWPQFKGGEESDHSDPIGNNRRLSKEATSWVAGNNPAITKQERPRMGPVVDSDDYDKIVETRTTETVTDSQPVLSSGSCTNVDTEDRNMEKQISFGELDKKLQGKYSDPSMQTHPTDLSTSTGESIERYKVDGVHVGQIQHQGHGMVDVRSLSTRQADYLQEDYALGKRTVEMRDRPDQSRVLHNSAKVMPSHRSIKRQKTDENSQSSQDSDFEALNSLQNDGLNPLQSDGLNALRNDGTGSTGSLSSGESEFNAMNFYDPQELAKPRGPVQGFTTDQTQDRSQQETLFHEPLMAGRTKIHIVQGEPVEPHSYNRQEPSSASRMNSGPAPRIPQTDDPRCCATGENRKTMVQAPPGSSDLAAVDDYRQRTRRDEMSQADMGEMNVYPWGTGLQNQAGACMHAAATTRLIETSYRPMHGTTPEQRNAEWVAFEQAKREWEQNLLATGQMQPPGGGFDPIMEQRNSEWPNAAAHDHIKTKDDGFDPITQQRSSNSNGNGYLDHAGAGFDPNSHFQESDWIPGVDRPPEALAANKLQTLHDFLDAYQAEGKSLPAALQKALHSHRTSGMLFNEESAVANYENNASAFYDQYEDENDGPGSNRDKDSDADAILADRYGQGNGKTPRSPSESTVDEAELRAAAEVSGIPPHVIDLVLGYSKNVRPATMTPFEGAPPHEQPGNVPKPPDVVLQHDEGIEVKCGFGDPPALSALQRCTGQQPTSGRDPSPRRGRSPTPRSPSQTVASDVPEGATEEEIKLLNRFIEAAACFFDGKKLSTDSETRVRSAASKVGISELFVDQLIEQAESKNMEIQQQQEAPPPEPPYPQNTRDHDVASGFYTVDVSKLQDSKTEVEDPGCSFWGGLSKNFAFLKHQARCFDETSSINSSPSRSWEEEAQRNALPPLPVPPPPPPPPPTRIDARRGYV